MLNKCNYIWRLLIIWLGFLLFGIASLVASIVLFIPWLVLPKKITKKLTQQLIKLSYKIVVLYLTTTGVMTLRYENIHFLKNLHGTLIIANHPTFLDVVALLSEVNYADCIVKGSLWRNPFLVGIVKTAQYINSIHPHEMILTCRDRLQSGQNVLIFPEGTRSNPEHLQEFKRGFASIAIFSQCKIVPVFFHCQPTAFSKKTKWYQTSKSKFTLHISAFPELPIAELLSNIDDKDIQSKELSKRIEGFFQELFKYQGNNADLIYQKHFATGITIAE